MGLCCIATDIRGCREILTDGVTGFLYPAGNIAFGADVKVLRQPGREGANERKGAGRCSEGLQRVCIHRQVSAIEKLLREKGRT